MKKKHRARVIEFFIDVARECFNIGNFNSLMAIICKLFWFLFLLFIKYTFSLIYVFLQLKKKIPHIKIKSFCRLGRSTDSVEYL